MSSLALALLVLSACGGGQGTPPPSPTKTGTASSSSQSSVTAQNLSVDTVFQPLLSKFVMLSVEENHPVTITNLTITMVPQIDSLTAGNCNLAPGVTKGGTIQISQAFWGGMNSQQQEDLLFHQLGHCVLGRVHRLDLNNGLPLSIMSPSLIAASTYQANEGQYYYELFTGTDSALELPLR